MIPIPTPFQNVHHRPRPLTGRLRPILRLIHWPQITHREPRAERKNLPPLGSVLVRLTYGEHVECGFGGAVGELWGEILVQ